MKNYLFYHNCLLTLVICKFQVLFNNLIFLLNIKLFGEIGFYFLKYHNFK
jgi:hypothetical protein